MIFAWPIVPGTVAMIAAALAAATVAAYLLRMRRRRFEVPFSSLWQRVLEERDASRLWKRLRRWLSLLLALAILGLLLFAVSEPTLGEPSQEARSVVFVVDASASMKATDAGPEGDRPRIDVARERALELLDALGADDAAMILRMDGRPSPISRFARDSAKLRPTLASLEASDTSADLAAALAIAADALRGRPRPIIVLVGDGAYPERVRNRVTWELSPDELPAGAALASSEGLAAIELGGIDVRFAPVGTEGANVGIVAFNVRRYISNRLSYEIFIEIQNSSDAPARRKLVLYNGELEVAVETLELSPGAKIRQSYPDLGGGNAGVLRAVLEAPAGERDLLAADDEAWALMPAQKSQSVLLVTADNLYLEGAMLVYDALTLFKLSPEDYLEAASAGELGKFGAVVFDDVAPPILPPAGTNLLYFHPGGPDSPFPLSGRLPRAGVTEVSASHPVMRWIQMIDVNFDALDVYELDRGAGEVPLALSLRSPVAAATVREGRKVAAFGFALGETDLTLRVAFPLLLVNILDWFAGTHADLMTTYATGTPARVPLSADADAALALVRGPDGRTSRLPIEDGELLFYGDQIGVYEVLGAASEAEDGAVALRLAANLFSAEESSIHPSAELVLGKRTLPPPDSARKSARQSLWLYSVLIVLALLVLEWFTYHRRITV